MKKITQLEFDSLPIKNGIKICPSFTDYSQVENFGKSCSFGGFCSFGKSCSFGEFCSFGKSCSFGEFCSFGKSCSFGELCIFGKSCSFLTISPTLLNANFGNISDKLCTEMMRHNAQFHPDPTFFDLWAKGGSYPYKDVNVERKFNFCEKKELWISGVPTMTDYELLLALFDEKEWKLINECNNQ